MAFVREIAEKITVLHLGEVLAEGDIGAIEANPRVRDAYLGSRALSMNVCFDRVDAFYSRSHILHEVSLDLPDGRADGDSRA